MFLCRVLFSSCYETPFLTVSENILHTLLEFLNICPLKSNKKNPILEYLKNILCSNDQKHLYVFRVIYMGGKACYLNILDSVYQTVKTIVLKFIQTLFILFSRRIKTAVILL